MMKHAKIILSKDELKAAGDCNFFAVKSRVTKKIYHQYANAIRISNDEKIFQKIHFPPGTDFTTGKIAKGENYLGLPYILLDFPRNFNPKHLLTIRTMFWWGNFLSSTLLLSVEGNEPMCNNILRHYSKIKKQDIWLCVNDSPWIHHFEQDNYRKAYTVSGKEAQDMIDRNGFIKIARKIPVTALNQAENFMLESFRIFADCMK